MVTTAATFASDVGPGRIIAGIATPLTVISPAFMVPAPAPRVPVLPVAVNVDWKLAQRPWPVLRSKALPSALKPTPKSAAAGIAVGGIIFPSVSKTFPFVSIG